MKKSLASLELAALTNEFRELVNSKVSQIYHQKEEFLFQLHTKKGKQLLRIIPGGFLNLTQTKKTFLRPSSLCMQLRKYLNNAVIRKIQQKDSERILIFEIEKKEKYFLIIELFAPGNLVLTDKNYLVIAVLHQQKFKDRFVKPKKKYIFPASQPDWKKLSEKQLGELLKKSQKKNLAASLATEIGLGGLYAEEACKLNKIDKNKLPKEVEEKEIRLLLETIIFFLKQIEKPSGFIYDEQITPFSLSGEKEKGKTGTYNKAIDTLKPLTVISPYEKKIRSLKRIIEEQQEAVQKQESLIDLNNKKAELIYQKYQPLQKLLEIVNRLKQTKSWEEIKQELRKEKKIEKIDLKNKKVVIDL